MLPGACVHFGVAGGLTYQRSPSVVPYLDLAPHLPSNQTNLIHHIPHFLPSTCLKKNSHNSRCPPKVPSKSLLDKRSWASKSRISYPFEAILDSRSVVHSRRRRVDVLQQQDQPNSQTDPNSIKQLHNLILFIVLLVCLKPLLKTTKCVFSSWKGFEFGVQHGKNQHSPQQQIFAYLNQTFFCWHLRENKLQISRNRLAMQFQVAGSKGPCSSDVDQTWIPVPIIWLRRAGSSHAGLGWVRWWCSRILWCVCAWARALEVLIPHLSGEGCWILGQSMSSFSSPPSSTATICVECYLPDLNLVLLYCDHLRPVFPAGPQPQGRRLAR